MINRELNLYKEPTTRWINSNIRFAQRKVNEIHIALYEEELPDLVNRLSFEELFKIPTPFINALVYVFAEVEKDTRFESLEDQIKNYTELQSKAFSEDEILQYNEQIKELEAELNRLNSLATQEPITPNVDLEPIKEDLSEFNLSLNFQKNLEHACTNLQFPIELIILKLQK